MQVIRCKFRQFSVTLPLDRHDCLPDTNAFPKYHKVQPVLKRDFFFLQKQVYTGIHRHELLNIYFKIIVLNTSHSSTSNKFKLSDTVLMYWPAFLNRCFWQVTDNHLFLFQMRDHRSRLSRLSHRCFEYCRPTLFGQTDVYDSGTWSRYGKHKALSKRTQNLPWGNLHLFTQYVHASSRYRDQKCVKLLPWSNASSNCY